VCTLAYYIITLRWLRARLTRAACLVRQFGFLRERAPGGGRSGRNRRIPSHTGHRRCIVDTLSHCAGRKSMSVCVVASMAQSCITQLHRGDIAAVGNGCVHYGVDVSRLNRCASVVHCWACILRGFRYTASASASACACVPLRPCV
jgi:hypothetical protein